MSCSMSLRTERMRMCSVPCSVKDASSCEAQLKNASARLGAQPFSGPRRNLRRNDVVAERLTFKKIKSKKNSNCLSERNGSSVLSVNRCVR